MNNEGLPIKMFGQFKDKRFLVSGLKEGCDGLIGIERRLGGRPSPTGQCQHLLWASARSGAPHLPLVRKQDWALEKILCVRCLRTAR